MGATTAISVEEYLASNYEPDMDYVDGVLEDRNVGEEGHSWLQGQLVIRLSRAGFTFIYPELRLRVSATRYRIPDLCVYLERQKESIPTSPPVLAIEILSPDDRMSRIMARLTDYIAMGCPCVWLVDPQQKVAYTFDGTLTQRDELTHPSIPSLRVMVSELF